jgi:hypothetical protein
MSKELNISEVITRSQKIREQYHQLEVKHHGSEWTIEEDALAFLTDAALVGRLTMSHQDRWPKENTAPDLSHKLGETIWWVTVLAGRMGIDMNTALDDFLIKTENLLTK